MSQIIGIFLVKNEENFIAWSLMNVIEFCDQILVLDNLSSDRTDEIVNNIVAAHNHVEIIKVKDANNTQHFLKRFFGTETWVLGVDGDEIHDPSGLIQMRSRIKSGEFNQFWSISSRYLHVTGFNFTDASVSGYTSPPAKAGLKLYNFNAIDNWHSQWRNRERLHGKGLKFRKGYSKKQSYKFSVESDWDSASFKCLHLCFFSRSSVDTDDKSPNLLQARKNPAESRIMRRLTRKIERLSSKNSDYRKKRYARGNVATFDLSSFGRPDNFAAIDSKSHDVMKYLQQTKITI